jgi:hypothetical protein
MPVLSWYAVDVKQGLCREDRLDVGCRSECKPT